MPEFKRPGTIRSQLPDNAVKPDSGITPPLTTNKITLNAFWSTEKLRLSIENIEPLTEMSNAAHKIFPVSDVFVSGFPYRAEIAQAARKAGVSPALLASVMMVESGARVDAVSSQGAQGLMQLMPATARRFGVWDPFNPQDNVMGGAAYLDWLLKTFDDDPLIALAAYNAGEGAVTRAGGVPNYPETRAYVVKVLSYWHMARGHCLHPPQEFRDPCIFVRR